MFAVVVNVEAAGRLRPHLYHTAFGRELDGITEDVAQNGAQCLTVSSDEHTF